jgi:hypothetical protein
MWANDPEMAKEWEHKYGKKIRKSNRRKVKDKKK